MLEQISSSSYDNLRPVFSALDNHLTMASILSGSTPSAIYADSSSIPSVAIAMAGHRIHLGGKPSNIFSKAVGDLFEHHIVPEAREKGHPEMFVLYYAPAAWTPLLEKDLAHCSPILAERHYYETRELIGDWRPLLPEGIILRAVDQALLKETHLKHLGELKDEMCSERPSVEDFLEKSFGVCLLHENHIIGWCLSEYNTDNRCEIGIATSQAFRRRGLATAMTLAFVEEAQQRGIRRIGWHCWKSNLPSIATAMKAGFKLVNEFPVLYGFFDETVNLAEHGTLHLKAKQYHEAARLLKQAIATGQARSWVYWNAACACANADEPALAMEYLRQAAHLGFDDPEYFENSPQLINLHRLKAWHILIADLKEKAKEV